MCGIAGIFSARLSPEAIQHKTTRMTQRLDHRGPDSSSFFYSENIGLGHTRLSIVDLSETGTQPFVSPDKNVTVIFNGEIYNYLFLKDTLTQRGYTFKGTCDGEVLPFLYLEHGIDFLKKIEGMFSIALYDKKKSTLYLARDRIGEKPLFYTRHDNTLYFSSEIKSFSEIDGFDFLLNKDALTSYFLNTQVPAPLSIYKNIHKVMPAHYCTFSLTEPPVTAPYWHIDFHKKDASEVYAESVRAEIKNAIEKTLISDVPLGITLSGGVDSSLVLQITKELSEQTMDSFTLGDASLGFLDPEFDRASIMARQCETNPHIIQIRDLTFQDLAQAMQDYDEPIGVYDSFHLFYLAKHIQNINKVILTGNGADEVFGGYNSYIQRDEESKRIEKDCLKDLGTLEDKHNYLHQLLFDEYQNDYLYLQTKILTDNQDYTPAIFLDHFKPLSTYDNFLDARLINDLLISVNHSASLSDTPFMAHSIEARSPFLNHRLIEMVARLPNEQKINAAHNPAVTKFFLKEFARGYLPSIILDAPKLGCGQHINYEHLLTHDLLIDTENFLRQEMNKESLREHLSADKVFYLWEAIKGNIATTQDKGLFRKLFIFLLWNKHASLASD